MDFFDKIELNKIEGELSILDFYFFHFSFKVISLIFCELFSSDSFFKESHIYHLGQ